MLERVETMAGQYHDVMVLYYWGKDRKAAAFCEERGWNYLDSNSIWGCETQCVVLLQSPLGPELITRARNMLIILKSLPNASDTEELQSAVDHSNIRYKCERRMSPDRCDFDLCSECAMKNIKMGRKTECSKGHQLSAFELGDFSLWWLCNECEYEWSPGDELDQDVHVWRCEHSFRLSACPYTGTTIIKKIPWEEQQPAAQEMKKNVDVEMAVAEKEDDRETEESNSNRQTLSYLRSENRELKKKLKSTDEEKYKALEETDCEFKKLRREVETLKSDREDKEWETERSEQN